ncbi:MAG: long-chain fatty acid--CoA ligase, partial [Acidimicrobiia bacterium]|nr:long-chain fatty acid--CoA ligase [Acidimicrobiia bacterium]
MAPAIWSRSGAIPTRTKGPGRSPTSERRDGPLPPGAERVTLSSLLVDHPFADDEPLLCTIDGCVTAGAARADAAAGAERLRALGVGAREEGAAVAVGGTVAVAVAVAVQLPNDPSAVIALFATWLAGGVFVPLNIRQTVPEVEAALEATQPTVFVGVDGVRPLAAAGRRYDPDVAFVTWTSGTTGTPKPVLHTHSGYLEILDRVLGPLRGGRRATSPGTRAAEFAKGAEVVEGAGVAEVAEVAKGPTPSLIPVSLALNAGIYNVLFGLRAGAAVVIMERFTTAEFAELVRRFEIRSTVLPPAAMTMLADDPAVTDLSPLRYVRSITAPLSPLGARRFQEKFGVTVLNGYGQAEIGEVIGWTAADAREHPEKLGAVGRPHAGVDVKLSGTGEVGELLVRPPRAAEGIDASRVDADGFVRTGDLARVDEDGFVWIEGRRGDVINRGGNKVFPDHVEEVVRLAAGVRDVAVVGVPDVRLGEVPVAFVVGEFDEAELAGLCREHLVAYKVPVAFVAVDELPRSEVGK